MATGPLTSPSDPLSPLGAPGAFPGAPGASPGLGTPPPSTQPKTDVYTVMLIISFIAVVTAVVLLYMHLQTYGDWPMWKVPAEAKGV